MGKTYYAGTDIGTQSTRVIIYDERGTEAARGSAKHPPMVSPQQGWMEHGKKDLWEAFCKAAKMAMENFKDDPQCLKGISFACQSTTIFPISADGELLYNPISWMDGRTIPEADDLPADTPEELRSATKLTKANWFKQVHPEIYERTAKFLTAGGYISYMLTGETSDSFVNCLNNWTADRENWKPETDPFVWKCYGMRPEQVPEWKTPCEKLGEVTEKAAALTGLPVGLNVYAGALDKESEAVGSGITTPNRAYITTGTCTTMARISDKNKAGKFSTLMPVPGLHNYPVIVGKGFWIVSWFRDQLCQDLAGRAKQEGKSIEQLLGEEAEKISAGSEGLIVLPEWQPILGIGHTYGKGMMFGFDDRHTRAHMYRALLEGIVMQIRQGYEEDYDPDIIKDLEEVRIGGGGSQSSMFMQIAADVLGVRVIRTNTTETCSLGAAMYAAVGSGLYKDLHEAAKFMTSDTDVFTPIPENQALYDKLYKEIFAKTYGRMEPVLNELAGLTGDADVQFFI